MAKLLEKVAQKPFGRGPTERIQRDEINEYADVLRNFTFLEPPSSGAFQIADVLREAQDILGDEGKRGRAGKGPRYLFLLYSAHLFPEQSHKMD